MLNINKILSTIPSALIAVILLTSSQLALAAASDKSEGKGNGHNKNIGVGNASDGIMASVKTSKHVYYTGDPLEISLRFCQGFGTDHGRQRRRLCNYIFALSGKYGHNRSSHWSSHNYYQSHRSYCVTS